MVKTAIKPTRSEDFAEWYQQVIYSAELAEHSPVRGSMVIKPYGYAIWENIQKIFDERLKKIDVQNAYFPLLIPLEFLSKEAEHIEGFAQECAVVTHSRLKKDEGGDLVPEGKLSAPYIIRPTSEAIIGHIISKWINTYRDLPLKLNQWCNVMRWEMRPRLFLRTSEFLWQEGHTVFGSEPEAQADALKMLDMYYDLIAGDLALPAIKGEKTSEETFPGAKNTYTIEVMAQDGKALQAGTSHYLGQTFSEAFHIKFLGKDNKEHLAYTASWGISTRLIGSIIMSHADDNGLVLPPQIAPYQVVIIPVIHNDSQSVEINNYCSKIKEELSNCNIRTHIDITENSIPNKIWKWIKKGAPIRVEVGFKEVSGNTLTIARRDLEGKISLSIDSLNKFNEILKEITNNLREKAINYRNERIIAVKDLNEMESLFAKDFKGFALIDKSKTDDEQFLVISKQYSLSRRCIPRDQVDSFGGKAGDVLVGKSY